MLILLSVGTAFCDAAKPASSAMPAAAVAAPAENRHGRHIVGADSALVMLMTPGLAFFYGGLVRRKNYLNVLMQCMIILGCTEPSMGALRLQPCVRPGAMDSSAVCNGSDLKVLGWNPYRGLFRDDSASGVYDISGDVCGDYAGADYRRICRANEVFGVSDIHVAVGDICL